ncbi:hypothetical protein LMH87_002417 [Akanthomyces muscarius]|uniref:Uncharacterized protein n=1 Tax=Akanthomyces muscarius TaxID=2231603 RepID=A0A9W8UJM7_AKAMU|nr:hypothetical protein LMH87_002417 [Akanthomyces muscarius]KAJ4147923.1 hypothetical protein LMH87_002417 [Akanthomyces muscarius]
MHHVGTGLVAVLCNLFLGTVLYFQRNLAIHSTTTLDRCPRGRSTDLHLDAITLQSPPPRLVPWQQPCEAHCQLSEKRLQRRPYT